MQLLPARSLVTRLDTKVAELEGMPYSDYVKLILKVSYNIGADTSLLLYGLTHGCRQHAGCAPGRNEKLDLQLQHTSAHELHFVDGSGGGLTTATSRAVTQMLIDMHEAPAFPDVLRCDCRSWRLMGRSRL